MKTIVETLKKALQEDDSYLLPTELPFRKMMDVYLRRLSVLLLIAVVSLISMLLVIIVLKFAAYLWM